MNEGSLYFREEINRLCGFCFLSYNWIRPFSYLDWGPPMLGDHVWFRRPQLCSAVLWGRVSSLPTIIVGRRTTRTGSKRPGRRLKSSIAFRRSRSTGGQTDLLLCSWPYRDDSCYQALLKMREVNPSMKMIYIGEPAGQATASDQFFDAMEEVDDDSFLCSSSQFPARIHDPRRPYAHQMTGRRPANAGRIFVHSLQSSSS